MTLATLQAQHPDWCFNCGKHPKLDGVYSCYPHPVIAALKEELAKAEASPSNWQPIETAPKDGTWVILSKIGGPVWCDCRWAKMQRVPDRWQSFIGSLPFEPTHWMPTPEPPELEALRAERGKETK